MAGTNARAPMPPVLSDALRALPRDAAERFIQHLHGGTSANYLSDWLGRTGNPVSATTLKQYRRAAGAQGGVDSVA